VPGAPTSPRNQARLIDTKLAIPLPNLPPTVVNDPMVSLAQRNLIRASGSACRPGRTSQR
jgi:hypothetical protein